VAAILNLADAGVPTQDIAELYERLSVEDVWAIIDYAATGGTGNAAEVGTVEVEIDDEIAADADEQRRAGNAELRRIADAISSLPPDQQAAAWKTYRALIADRTDRAMTRAIATAEQDGSPEQIAALRAEWERIKTERKDIGTPP
jgi:hypothetical protein